MQLKIILAYSVCAKPWGLTSLEITSDKLNLDFYAVYPIKQKKTVTQLGSVIGNHLWY